MKKALKKVMAVLTMVCMLMTLIPVLPVSADTWDGTFDTSWFDNSLDTFTITTAEQFAAIGYMGSGQCPDIPANWLENKQFILGADIVLNDFVYEDTLSFEESLNTIYTITRAYDKFVLNGNGHTIYGLYLSPTGHNFGLVGELIGGTIKDLTLSNAFINGGDYVGAGILGVSRGATLDNITITDSHFVSNVEMGGIILENSWETGIVSDCKVLNTDFKVTGGVAGIALRNYEYATIINCEADITIDSSSNMGGIVATNKAIIDSCTARMVYTGASDKNVGTVGGIVARCEDSSLVKNCYAEMDVHFGSYNPVGIIAGQLLKNSTLENCLGITHNGVINSYGSWASGAAIAGQTAESSEENEIRISNCVGIGNVVQQGVLASNSVPALTVVENAFYKGPSTINLINDKDKLKTATNIDYLDSEFKTTTDGQDAVAILNNWVAKKGNGYKTWSLNNGVLSLEGTIVATPKPTAEPTATPEPTPTPTPSPTPTPTPTPEPTPTPKPVPTPPSTITAWNGTYDTSWFDDSLDTYTIYTAEQFAAIGYIGSGQCAEIPNNWIYNKKFKLGADIIMNDFVYEDTLAFEESLKSFDTISSGGDQFEIDGQGHTIYGFYMAPTVHNFGIVRELYGGTIKNLTFVNAYINTEEYIGALILGVSRGATVDNITITNSHLYSGSDIAGIIMENSQAKGIVSDCKVVDTDIQAQHGAAGIVLRNYDSSSIINCEVDVTIDGGGNLGGIASVNKAIIDNCTAKVKNSGAPDKKVGSVGAVAGRCEDGSIIKNCYAEADFNLFSYDAVGIIAGQLLKNAVLENCIGISEKGIINTLGDGASASAIAGQMAEPMEGEEIRISNCVGITDVANKGVLSGNNTPDNSVIENAFFKGPNTISLLNDMDKLKVATNIDYLDDNYKTATDGHDVVDILNAWVAKNKGYNAWVMGANGPEFGTASGPDPEPTPVTYVAEVDGVKCESLAEAITAANGGEITLLKTIVLDEDGTIDFGGATIVADGTVDPFFRVVADVTVKNGTVKADNGTSYAFIIGSSDLATSGNLTVESGNYYGTVSVVSVSAGNLTIEGGYFEATPYNGDYRYTINCYDASYKAGNTTVVINGGTFYGFNPADNLAEGTKTNFAAEGYVGVDNGDGTFGVKLDYSIALTETNVVTTGVYESAVIILASYNGTRLIDVKYVPVTEDADITIASTGLDVSGATSINAMLLKDITNIMPLCAAAK